MHYSSCRETAGFFWGVAQWTERRSSKPQVEGSNPSISAITIKNIAQSVEQMKIYCEVQILIHLGWQ